MSISNPALEPAWSCRTETGTRREIPPEVRMLLERPDSVENVTDGLKILGFDSYVEFPGCARATPEFGVQVGPVLPLRYVPKRARNQDNRLGHDLIAKTLAKGDILVVDQHGCSGGIAGGNALGKLFGAGARALVVDGAVRDFADACARKAPTLSLKWGIASGRTTVELIAIGEPINFHGIAVHPQDVAIVNQWGMALVPQSVPWDVLLHAAKIS